MISEEGEGAFCQALSITEIEHSRLINEVVEIFCDQREEKTS
jgi:hypothetical protein